MEEFLHRPSAHLFRCVYEEAAIHRAQVCGEESGRRSCTIDIYADSVCDCPRGEGYPFLVFLYFHMNPQGFQALDESDGIIAE